MLSIGLGELLVVLLVAFVVVGPDDLPKAARRLGRSLRKLRTLLKQLREEAGWDEVEKEVGGVREEIRQTVDTLHIAPELTSAAKDVENELNGLTKDAAREFREVERELNK